MTTLRKLWEKYNFEDDDKEVEVLSEADVHRKFKKYVDPAIYDPEEIDPDYEEDMLEEELDEEELDEEMLDEFSGAGAGAVSGSPMAVGGEWVDEDEYKARIENTKNRMHIKGK